MRLRPVSGDAPVSSHTNRESLVDQIRSVRTSLRGPTNPAVEDTPVEEYERRQSYMRLDLQEALSLCALAWLASQAFLLLSFVGVLNWTEPQPSWLWVSVGLLWGISMALATAMAVLAARYHHLLRKRWLIGGVTPWMLLTAEALLVLFRLT